MAFTSEKPKSSAASSRIIRPFGHFERYQEALVYHEQYCGTSATCRYQLPPELADVAQHAEAQKRLIQAIALTVLDHPMLQVGIIKERTRKPAFVKIDQFDLENVIRWRVVAPSEDYAAIVQASITSELDTKFTHLDTLPGWRVNVWRPEEGAFLDIQYNQRHTNCDGTSLKIFHRTLLNKLNNVPADLTHLELQGTVLKLPEDNVNYPPPLHKVVKFDLSPGFTVSCAWKELKPPFLARKQSGTQRSWGTFVAGPAKTNRRTIRISADKTAKIIEACRAHKTTLTALLHGIAFASMLQETATKVKEPSFQYMTAIDFRRFVTGRPKGLAGVELDAKNTMANIVSVKEHETSVEEVAKIKALAKEPVRGQGMIHMENVVWAVADLSRRDIEEKLKDGTKNDIVGMMKFVPDWLDEQGSQTKKPRRESWLVTNLGAMEGTTEGAGENAWRISRANFSLSAEVAKPLVTFSVMSIKGRDMCIDVTWQAGLSEYVESVSQRMEPDMHAWLNYIATGAWEETGGLAAFDKGSS